MVAGWRRDFCGTLRTFVGLTPLPVPFSVCISSAPPAANARVFGKTLSGLGRRDAYAIMITMCIAQPYVIRRIDHFRESALRVRSNSFPRPAHPQRSISNQSPRDPAARDTIGLHPLPQLAGESVNEFCLPRLRLG
jgi:hypothetical protein